MDSLQGQKLLNKDGKVILADEALADKKIILFYFSAHWCPPCRAFTPILNDFYTVRHSYLLVLINSFVWLIRS